MGVDFNFTLESHLGARPAEGKIQAGYLRGFKSLVHRLGGQHERILQRHGIDPGAFEDHAYHVDCIAAVNLLEYSAAHLNAPLFGLMLADLQTPDVFGCVATLARAAPDLRQALAGLAEYTSVINSPEGRLEVVADSQVAELRWGSALAVASEQAHYHGLFLILKTLRMLGGPAFRTDCVNLTLDVPAAHARAIQDRIGCRVRPRAAVNGISFPAVLLDMKVATADRLLFDLMRAFLEKMSAAAPASMLQQAEAFIDAALPAGSCNIEKCAAKLGMAPRTLQKHLAAEGRGFSALVEARRIFLAKRALAGRRLSLDEIAFDLGYAEQASFGRAFKRWTGVTPLVYRLGGGR